MHASRLKNGDYSRKRSKSMFGVIVCTHSTLAEGLKNAIDMIVGPQEDFDVFCFMNGDDVEELSGRLNKAVDDYIDRNIPCCIMVDLFAATPFNASLAISIQKGIDVITGVNLPLLLEVLLSRTTLDSKDIHGFLEKSLNSVKESMKVYNGIELESEG